MPGRVKTKKLSASHLEKLARFRAMAEQQLVNLGAAIEDARKEAGLSRAKLAQRIPVEAKTIYRWEKGSTGGAMENLRSIAACLDTTPDQLLNAAVAKNRKGPCGWVGPDRTSPQEAEEDFERHVRAVEEFHKS